MAIYRDEEEVARTTNVYDGPQTYNFEPGRPYGRQSQLNGLFIVPRRMSGELIKCPGELLSFSNAATTPGARL